MCERSYGQNKTPENKSTSSPSFEGGAGFTSNFVEKGLSQSNQEPAILGKLGLNYPSGFLGIWGSNSKVENEDIHLNYRIMGNLRLDIISGVDVTASYKNSRFVSDGSRNGNIWGIDLNLYSWHALFEHEDNFEALKKNRYWFAFGKEWPLWGMFLSSTLGYSMIQAEGYTNFFDYRITLSYRWNKNAISISGVGNSASSQFGKRSQNTALVTIESNFY